MRRCKLNPGGGRRRTCSATLGPDPQRSSIDPPTCVRITESWQLTAMKTHCKQDTNGLSFFEQEQKEDSCLFPSVGFADGPCLFLPFNLYRDRESALKS